MLYVGKDRSARRKVLFQEGERNRAFVECHASASGAHVGRKNTLYKLTSRFYWKTMKRDFDDWVCN
jgi:hypothetical protein